MLDHGSDEIGQVAEAFNTAQRTAVAAAVAEARTRGGINKVFLDIAHRSQLVVHRQLELLDVAEAKQSDPSTWSCCSSWTTWPPGRGATPRTC